MVAVSGKGCGGKRKGAGRPKGKMTQKAQEIAAEVAKRRITPLEVMVEAMEHAYDKQDFEGASKYAAMAAPYMHPRLNASEVKSEVTVRYVARVPEKAKSTESWLKQAKSQAEAPTTTTRGPMQ